MNLFIKQAIVLDQKSVFHNQKCDLIIENGKIAAIGKTLDNNNNYKEISHPDLHISNGWFDSSVALGEPGLEERETIQNGLNVAAKSGFTAIALQPLAQPIIDSVSQIELVKYKSHNALTQLYPIGALTKESHSKELAELFDMHQNGAVAFGDYATYMDNANLFKIALQYLKDFDGLLLTFSQDNHLKGKGIAHEGLTSTRLGMKGIPPLAEELAVARNLQILEYTGGRMHIPTISTIGAIELIKKAKAKGLQVSCSVAVHQLVLTDAELENFDSNAKVNPPLRTDDHRKALIKAVKDGVIDTITSDHNPIDIENKKLEFDLAKDGTVGLESAFSALMNVLPVEIIVEKLTSGRSIFGIPSTTIAEGEKADLTLFSTEGKWTFETSNILSKSKNSAFLGKPMSGKVVGTISGNKACING